MVRIVKGNAQNVLGNVPQEFVFRCCDGRTLANLHELGDALGSMSDEVFAFHVTPDKNDFSNWTKDIIRDNKLAQDLNKVTSKAQAAKIVASRLSFLQKSAH